MAISQLTSLITLLLLVQSWEIPKVLSLSNSTDQLSLIAFKSAITSDTYNILRNNWTEDTNFCDWVGVTCSQRRQRVTALRLVGMGLLGPISPYIGNLSFLMEIELMNNSFYGQVIHEFSYLRRLQILALDWNNLEGTVPANLQKCKNLEILSFADNKLTGGIPKEIGSLSSLRRLYLGRNNLTGKIPSFLGNLSKLEQLALEGNNFYGEIPNLGNMLKLNTISFGQNFISGSMPLSLFNISSLELILLQLNNLSGELPLDNAVSLPNLQKLSIGNNQLSGSVPSYLFNSSFLTYFLLNFNYFSGQLPTNLSDSLIVIDVSNNGFYGEIPERVGFLQNLNYLILSNNTLSGPIPSTINGMKSLQMLYIDGNKLQGSIPIEICMLNSLGILMLQNNELSGSIPSCIGNLSGLQQLYMNSNKLNSTIPSSLWSLNSLSFLNLSVNLLSGGLDPNIMALRSLESMDISSNQMSSVLPDALGSFESLMYLSFAHNSFWGPIPESIGKLITLDFLDLSYNNLSSSIPKSLEALSQLDHLNLSHNNLSGEIPSGGPFARLSSQSFLENEELCGQIILKPCPIRGSEKSKRKLSPLSYTLPSVAIVLIFIAILLLFLKKRSKKVRKAQSSHNLLHGIEHKMIPHHELSRSTNNFSETNLLGVGSFSSVYKGLLPDGVIIAVKVLNLQTENAIKSFAAECNVLRVVRHRNLVKVISVCTNQELKALVLEYMPNGSLEKWLYSPDYQLDFLERVNIILDVVIALEYLHHGQDEPIIHCDLKPSNVLLDGDMVAHVSDFGIAKILDKNKDDTQTSTLGTFGYIAPEYGVDGRVSTKCDMYSFGILILETFTNKRPTDQMFSEDLTLRRWVNEYCFPESVMDVADVSLFEKFEGKGKYAVNNNLLAILDLGLRCSHELPEQRGDIKDVVNKLNKIKMQIVRQTSM